jgi:hypothetical protein
VQLRDGRAHDQYLLGVSERAYYVVEEARLVLRMIADLGVVALGVPVKVMSG